MIQCINHSPEAFSSIVQKMGFIYLFLFHYPIFLSHKLLLNFHQFPSKIFKCHTRKKHLLSLQCPRYSYSKAQLQFIIHKKQCKTTDMFLSITHFSPLPGCMTVLDVITFSLTLTASLRIATKLQLFSKFLFLKHTFKCNLALFQAIKLFQAACICLSVCQSKDHRLSCSKDLL